MTTTQTQTAVTDEELLDRLRAERNAAERQLAVAKNDSRKWEELADEAIADANEWKAQARRVADERDYLLRMLRGVVATLDQPAQYTKSDSPGVANILRVDAAGAMAIARRAIEHVTTA